MRTPLVDDKRQPAVQGLPESGVAIGSGTADPVRVLKDFLHLLRQEVVMSNVFDIGIVPIKAGYGHTHSVIKCIYRIKG